MAYSKTEQVAMRLAEPIAQNAGCYIYDVEFVKEGGVWFLRIFADKEEGGITLDECEVISRALSDALDREAPIEQNYYLEVSSPGVERRLKRPEHFKRYLGETVDVGLYRAIDGAKQLTGTLTNWDEDTGTLTVEINKTQRSIPQKDASWVKLHFDF